MCCAADFFLWLYYKKYNALFIAVTGTIENGTFLQHRVDEVIKKYFYFYDSSRNVEMR